MDLHSAADNRPYGSVFVQIFTMSCVKRFFSAKVRFGRSRSSKVIDFGTNQNRVYDFLLVRYGNLGPILYRFGATADFLLMIPPLFHPITLGVFRLDQIGDRRRLGQPRDVSRSIYLKLFVR